MDGIGGCGEIALPPRGETQLPFCLMTAFPKRHHIIEPVNDLIFE